MKNNIIIINIINYFIKSIKMSKNYIINKSAIQKLDSINQIVDEFLTSKDKALEPIKFLFGNDEDLDLGAKVRHLSIKTKKEKKSDRSKKSRKSQKSTSNTNKKIERKKSIRDSQLYSSNIVIVHNDEEEDEDSSTDPIEKEVEKLKKLMSKSRAKKKKRASKSYKSNQTK